MLIPQSIEQTIQNLIRPLSAERLRIRYAIEAQLNVEVVESEEADVLVSEEHPIRDDFVVNAQVTPAPILDVSNRLLDRPEFEERLAADEQEIDGLRR
jgi:hypothetical protein